jgi:hypothetical protein
MARPTVFTKQTLQKLEEAFALDCTDLEACFYANIAPSSLYNYQALNPSFMERKEALKQNPVLKARTELVKGLEGNPELALKYLERKRRDEFSPKSITEVKHTEPNMGNSPEMREIGKKYTAELKKILMDSIRERRVA